MRSDKFLSAIEILEQGSKFALVAHVMPDGDTIGSCSALMSVLMENGKHVDMYCHDTPPANLSFLQGVGDFRKRVDKNVLYDAVICLDCSDETRLGDCGSVLSNATRTVNIDHHITNTEYADINIVDPDASSTAELVYALIGKLNPKALSLPVCEALYTGIVTDTGGFVFSNTTAAAHRIAARLIECGVDVDKLNRLIYKNTPLDKVRLLGIVLNSLEMHMKDTIAFLTVSRSMIKQAGFTDANYDDSSTEGLINYAIDINGVECAALFKEIENNKTKVSFRTKTKIDASALATRFGGGGHVRAAGCTIEENLEKSKVLVLEALKNMLDGMV
ncbi:MAG: bifunctional oligoribonuclease/PAP phosphatase NrnA [Clostridiales bacterium]|jgi:phosphoesterase RecJ-like protein|nr:bifunctional oligoribonuclease/PAP phosphatase NrnA [Clostridiales bacterium]